MHLTPISAHAATNYAAMDGRGGSAEEAALRREWARHEAVMAAIADAGSQESSIAARASERITAICRELGLDDSVIELAHQARVMRWSGGFGTGPDSGCG